MSGQKRKISCDFLKKDCYGCSIFNTTIPNSCDTYKCYWLAGYGFNEHRPDKSGVLIDYREFSYGKYLTARPVYENATKSIEGLDCINHAAQNDLILVLDLKAENIKCISGPEDEVETFSKKYIEGNNSK